MSKRAKQLMSVLGILIILFGLYYFFVNKGPVTPDNSGSDLSATSRLLPNGDTLDVGSLRDPRLQNMNPPQYPTVDRSELGTGNPFK